MRSRVVAPVAALGIVTVALGAVWALSRAPQTAHAAPLAAAFEAVDTMQEPLAATGEAPVYAASAPTMGALVLTTAVPSLEIFDAPNGAVKERLGSLSTYGSPRTLLGVSDGSDVEGWVRVQLPNRQGHEYGWVRTRDVVASSTTIRVDVYLADHELDVTIDGEVVLTTPVAVGSPATPTPLGLYYVTDPINLTGSPGGVYGPYILGLSGYSDSFTTFNGGAPQLAIHGTSSPSSIGSSVSNGCIRVPNATITKVAGMVPLGTPVAMHASRADG